jgi:hypothetical protein
LIILVGVRRGYPRRGGDSSGRHFPTKVEVMFGNDGERKILCDSGEGKTGLRSFVDVVY